MENSTIKILVVDDSAFNRKVLTKILEKNTAITVVATASDGEEAFKKLVEYEPDLITLDLEMPKMDGFTFLRLMMAQKPTPTIVISSLGDNKTVFQALEMGAVDFVVKPTHHISTDIENVEEELTYKVKAALEAKLSNLKAANRNVKLVFQPFDEEITIDKLPVILIGASTGGPAALHTLLSLIPPTIPAAICVAQHMPRGFTKSFADRLNKSVELNVVEAHSGMALVPGTVFICPGGEHMDFKKIDKYIKMVLTDGTSEDPYIPSIDNMFIAGAREFGPNAMAVVMTGMGSDGKLGVVSVKSDGGHTLAQSMESAVVSGMPREAISTGSIDEVADLNNLAVKIVDYCRNKTRDLRKDIIND